MRWHLSTCCCRPALLWHLLHRFSQPMSCRSTAAQIRSPISEANEDGASGQIAQPDGHEVGEVIAPATRNRKRCKPMHNGVSPTIIRTSATPSISWACPMMSAPKLLTCTPRPTRRSSMPPTQMMMKLNEKNACKSSACRRSPSILVYAPLQRSSPAWRSSPHVHRSTPDPCSPAHRCR